MALNPFVKLFNNFVCLPVTHLQKLSICTLQRTATTEPGSVGGFWSLIPIRTNIRNNFPRAREHKRIKVHGWNTRMSTPSGRRILMRRILKGRHVLSH